jgi:hypothetical protein
MRIDEAVNRAMKSNTLLNNFWKSFQVGPLDIITVKVGYHEFMVVSRKIEMAEVVQWEGVMNYELRITNYELRITSYELRVTNYELRITSYELWVEDYIFSMKI